MVMYERWVTLTRQRDTAICWIALHYHGILLEHLHTFTNLNYFNVKLHLKNTFNRYR